MLFNPDLFSLQAAIEQATMLNHQYTNGSVSMDGVEDLSMKSNRNSSSDTLSKPESPSRWADNSKRISISHTISTSLNVLTLCVPVLLEVYVSVNLMHYLIFWQCSNTLCFCIAGVAVIVYLSVIHFLNIILYECFFLKKELKINIYLYLKKFLKYIS